VQVHAARGEHQHGHAGRLGALLEGGAHVRSLGPGHQPVDHYDCGALRLHGLQQLLAVREYAHREALSPQTGVEQLAHQGVVVGHHHQRSGAASSRVSPPPPQHVPTPDPAGSNAAARPPEPPIPE
jgi:hypothetical protein